MDNEVLKAIRERRSIRRFKPEQITDEELTAVLEAGTWAATGHGTQAPFIVAVQNPAQRDFLASLNAEIFGIDSDPYYGAPTLVLVFAPKDNDNNYRDGSLVLGNMMLAAHSIGLASCWINRVDRMSEREQCQQLMREWGARVGPSRRTHRYRFARIGICLVASSHREAAQGRLLSRHQIAARARQ